MSAQQLEPLFYSLSLGGSAAASLAFLGHLVSSKRIVHRIGMALLIATFGTLMGVLVTRAINAQHVPWSNFYEALIFATTAFLGMFFLVERKFKAALLSVGTAITAMLVLAVGVFLPESFKVSGPLVPALQSYWIKIHTSVILVSYSAFTLATVCAIIYVILNARKADPKLLRQFDELIYRVILLGFPLLAVGIITGAMWANHAWGTYWSWDPKETWSLITWLIYAAYLHLRMGKGWQGQKAVTFALVGFASVIFTYYGVNFLPGLHSYGFKTE